MVRLVSTGNHLVRIYSSLSRFHSTLVNSANHLLVNDDPQLFLDSVRQQCRFGFSNVDVPLSIFHQLNSLRPRPSIIVFNQLFTAMSKIQPNPPFHTVVTLSNRLQLSGLRPTSHSIGILAKCYCSLGRLDFAFSLMGKNLKLGYPPNIVVITILLNGLIDSHKLDQAVQLLDKTVKLGIQPDLVTYRFMFKGLCQSRDHAAALRLLRNMESTAPFKPDVVVYSTIIDSLIKDQLLPQALGLFKDMKAKSILPNVVTYNTLIRGLCSLGRWNDVKELLIEMENNGVAPDIVTYNTMINGLCEAHRLVEAAKVFSFLVAKRLRPNVTTYTTMVKVLCRQGLLGDATKLLKEMADNGCPPNERTYNTIIRGFLNANDIAMALDHLRIMRSLKFAVDDNTASLFLHLLTAGDVSDKHKALLQKYFLEYDGKKRE